VDIQLCGLSTECSFVDSSQNQGYSSWIIAGFPEKSKIECRICEGGRNDSSEKAERDQPMWSLSAVQSRELESAQGLSRFRCVYAFFDSFIIDLRKIAGVFHQLMFRTRRLHFQSAISFVQSGFSTFPFGCCWLLDN
jgi:hypothetical protein